MTSIAVERAAGRLRCTMVEGALSPRLLGTSGTHARIALVATGALLLGGDHVHLDVRVGAGATLEVVEAAGTVAFDAGGLPSSWSVSVVLDAGASLVWEGLPFVVSDGADVTRATDVVLGAGARALLRETYVLGRTGEHGGPLRTRTRVELEGRELFVEDLGITPAGRSAPGLVGRARTLDTALAAGWRPSFLPDEGVAGGPAAGRPAPGSVHRLDLDGPGAMARRLDTATHTSAELDAVWQAWRSEVQGAPPEGVRSVA